MDFAFGGESAGSACVRRSRCQLREKQDRDLKASLSFLAGSAAGGYGSGSDMSTGFSVERSIFSVDRVGLSGNSVTETAFLPPFYAPCIRTVCPTVLGLRWRSRSVVSHRLILICTTPRCRRCRFRRRDDFAIGDVLELRSAANCRPSNFSGDVTAFRPYGSIDVHVSPNTVLVMVRDFIAHTDEKSARFDATDMSDSESSDQRGELLHQT